VKTGLGCVAIIAAMGAVTVLVDRLTSASLPPELRFFVAVPAGVLLTLGLSNVWSLLRGYGRGDGSREALLERAQRGEAPSRDGPMVATGIVRAEGATVRAPISDTECVAYQYRLYSRRRLANGKLQEVPIYWGYACRSFRLDSASQAIHVLAVPWLADEPTEHDSTEARTRAQSYVAASSFEPKRALPGILSTVATTFSELVAEPSGDVRHDWRMDGVDFSFDSLLIEETVLAVGTTASIAGRWSVERRAIVPGEPGKGETRVTVVTGGPDELGRHGASELPWSARSVAITAAGLLLAGAALVWLSTTGRIAAWWNTL
jgi:hypothetical protein